MLSNLFSKNTIIALTLPFWASSVFAAALVDYLNVDGNAVHFSIAESKTQTPPQCAVAETNDKFAVSLNTEAGRAMYSLLITAMSTKQGVSVKTAGDCADIAGIERASSVSIQPAMTSQCSAIPTRKSEAKFVSVDKDFNTESDVWKTVVDIKSGAEIFNLYLKANRTSSFEQHSLKITIDGVELPITTVSTGGSKDQYIYHARAASDIPPLYAKKSLKVEIKRSNSESGNTVWTYVNYFLADFDC